MNTHKETDENNIVHAEIFPNEKIQLYFENGKSVALTYGAFTAQDAITLIGPPDDLFTKSDTRLNIHNATSRRDEIDSGPLSEGPPLIFLWLLTDISPILFL